MTRKLINIDNLKNNSLKKLKPISAEEEELMN